MARPWFHLILVGLFSLAMSPAEAANTYAPLTAVTRQPLSHPVAEQVLTAASQINCGVLLTEKRVVPISGSGGAVILTSDPQILAGVSGQECVLYGTSTTDTVTIIQGAGVDLGSAVPLTIGTIATTFIYANSTWKVARPSTVPESEGAVATSIATLPVSPTHGLTVRVKDALRRDIPFCDAAYAGGEAVVDCTWDANADTWLVTSMSSLQRAFEIGERGGLTHVTPAAAEYFCAECETLGDLAPRIKRYGEAATLFQECYIDGDEIEHCQPPDVEIYPERRWRVRALLEGSTTWIDLIKLDNVDGTAVDTVNGALGPLWHATDCTLMVGALEGVSCYEVDSNRAFWCEPNSGSFCDEAGDWVLPNAASVPFTPAGTVAATTTQAAIEEVSGDVTTLQARPWAACVEVVNAAAANDNVMFPFIAPAAITVTGVACKVLSGTVSVAPTFLLEDDDGNSMTITGGSPTCAAVGTDATWAAVTAGNALVAGEGIRLDVGNSPDGDDSYALCIRGSQP